MIEEVLIEAGLSVELIEKAFEATSEAVYERGTRILEIGEECKNIFIVQEGLLRMFYYGSKGNEITHWFTTENNLMTAPKSFFEGTRSQYAIETLEECTVRKLELKTLNQLCEEHQEFERFMRLLVIRMFMEMNNKVMDLQFKTAKERYLSLIERHPDIFQRVNLGHIASYIGITIQSLSRIRLKYPNLKGLLPISTHFLPNVKGFLVRSLLFCISVNSYNFQQIPRWQKRTK